MHVSALSLEATGLHSIITIITICSPEKVVVELAT